MALLGLQLLCITRVLSVCAFTLTSAVNINNFLRSSLQSAVNEKVCENGTTRKGHCDLSCTCVSGKWKCCRLRKSVASMPPEERKRYFDAFLKAASDPRYKEVFGQIAFAHSRFICTGEPELAVRQIISWRRMQTVLLENLLRLIDCRVTIPYWDYPLHFKEGWKATVFSPNVFGGNGSSSDFCVSTGPFRKGKYAPPGPHDGPYKVPNMPCIKRNFSTTHIPMSWKVVQSILTGGSENSVIVEEGLMWFVDSHMHASMHGSFAGTSPGVDPIFYSMHNFLDKLFASWQLRGKDFLNGHGRWNTTARLRNLPWFKATDWLDSQNLPGGVCLNWDGSQSPAAALETGYFASMPVPRKMFLHLPYKVLRHFKLNKQEATQYKDWLNFAKIRMEMLVTKTGNKLPDTGALHNIPGWKYIGSTDDSAPTSCGEMLKKDPIFLKSNVSNGAQIL